METRTCIKCYLEYPLEDKYFALAHGSTTRRVTVCRECRREYDRQYRASKYDEVKDDMYKIKEESVESKKHRLLKAFGYIYLNAFGGTMEENIYWCKDCDCVQITTDECGSCTKTMEKIGFVEYNKEDK